VQIIKTLRFNYLMRKNKRRQWDRIKSQTRWFLQRNPIMWRNNQSSRLCSLASLISCLIVDWGKIKSFHNNLILEFKLMIISNSHQQEICSWTRIFRIHFLIIDLLLIHLQNKEEEWCKWESAQHKLDLVVLVLERTLISTTWQDINRTLIISE
jgi:hypothetical protein